MDELVDYIFDFPTKDWIIWVGAGVSISNPTALPSGVELTKSILSATTNDIIQEKIFNIWEQANRVAATSENKYPFGIAPRLESILQETYIIEKKAKDSKFNLISGFSSFVDAPFNENHLHLAYLLQSGAVIITTNFDVCIQKAYNYLSGNTDSLVFQKINNVYVYKSNTHPQCGAINHIHGVAHNIPELGATIEIVKKGLDDKIRQFLDSKLTEHTPLIFLGYSASDSFDVNLFFTGKRTKELKKSTMIFIQHGTGEIPINARKIADCFENVKFENLDTSEFLKRLTRQTFSLQSSSSKFSWRNEFFNKTDLAELQKFKYMTACKYSNMLGININLLDKTAFRKVFDIKNDYDTLDFNKTLAIICRTRAKNRKEKTFDRESQKKESDMLGYYYAKGNLRKAEKLAKSIEQLRNDAMNKDVLLNWETYTSMSVHCRKIVKDHFANFSLNSHKDYEQAKIQELIAITDLLSNRPFSDVEYLNQVATALRFQVLLKSLLGEDDMVHEEKIFSIYGEVSSIIGYVSAYRDISLKNYFLWKYHNDVTFLIKSVEYIKKSLELAKIIGDKQGERRAMRFYFYYCLKNFFNILHFM